MTRPGDHAWKSGVAGSSTFSSITIIVGLLYRVMGQVHGTGEQKRSAGGVRTNPIGAP